MARFSLAAAACAALMGIGGVAAAQQSQTVIDQPQQVPNRSAIPEKLGAPIETRKPSAPEEKAATENEGRALPGGQPLEMKDPPVPNTGGTAPPAKPEA